MLMRPIHLQAMLLKESHRDIIRREALVDVRHSSRHDVIDPQLIDHGNPSRSQERSWRRPRFPPDAVPHTAYTSLYPAAVQLNHPNRRKYRSAGSTSTGSL